MKVDGSIAIIRIKNFPIGLHVMFLYLPDTPRTIGCACSKRIFFFTRNPCVVGGPNGMHVTQWDCVEELHYFAEPLKLSCLKSFALPSVYIGLVHHFATDTVAGLSPCRPGFYPRSLECRISGEQSWAGFSPNISDVPFGITPPTVLPIHTCITCFMILATTYAHFTTLLFLLYH